MVLTACFVLSPVIGLSCHRPRCDAGVSRPKGRHRHSILARLMPASRHQDHTTSPSASRAFVFAPKASTASPPNVRDDRETPLWIGHGMGRILPVIWEGDQLCPPAAD